MRSPIPILVSLFCVAVPPVALAGDAQAVQASNSPLPAPWEAALNRITPSSLKGHVSFLASDLLQGRGTPSKELDIAAEYIASQFRGAGLEPVGDDGFFQTAEWKAKVPDPGGFACELKIDGETIRIGEDQISGSLGRVLKIAPTEIVKVDLTDPNALRGPDSEKIAGKVVLARVPHPFRVERSRRQATNQDRVRFFLRVAELKPALVVNVAPDAEGMTGLRQDISRGKSRPLPPGPPVLTLDSVQVATLFDRLPVGPWDATFSIRLGALQDRTTKVRNVVGLLRGSDPALKDSYVILSAHYDHLGVGPQNAAGDEIFNGANDDASGTASVISIASALGTLETRPKRSVLFIAFYGEEFGMVGSKYYTAHPVVPLDKTVAAINLEQVGRTDDSEGPRVSAATVTGYDFSNVGEILRAAGELVGIAVTKHPKFSDRFFSASDNLSFAQAGIPAHTISVAFMFPDYHTPNDGWEQLDYANMAKVDTMAAAGLLTIANDPTPPRWDETNPRTEPYRKKAK